MKAIYYLIMLLTRRLQVFWLIFKNGDICKKPTQLQINILKLDFFKTQFLNVYKFVCFFQYC